MLVQIGNWLYQNAMAIFISAIASLLISKRYYDKANRESVLMMVIFPIVKLLNEKYYTRNDYEALFEINSSYAVKYLRKKERNKLLELLSAYRDVCKYSKENADTSCIMAYYNYKLKEKGINPKPCAITDDDGEVVADDFPPDYNYLQDYVYKIVSSFDFIESPEECTIKIADAFKCYTEKYYTGEEITYFKDYSIEKVIELSEISKKWNDKFRRADKSKEEFLNLPICKKVKNIIDESSVNKYVNRKIDEKEYNYKEYEQRRIRDNMILEDVKKANELGSISPLSDVRPTWQDSKTDLTELIYLLDSKGCFGNVPLTQLASYISNAFNVHLDMNLSRTFCDMKIRNNPTPWLDKAKEALLKRMQTWKRNKKNGNSE